MLDSANPSDLLLIQIMAELRHRYECLNHRYEKQLINDFRFNAPRKSFGGYGSPVDQPGRSSPFVYGNFCGTQSGVPFERHVDRAV